MTEIYELLMLAVSLTMYIWKVWNIVLFICLCLSIYLFIYMYFINNKKKISSNLWLSGYIRFDAKLNLSKHTFWVNRTQYILSLSMMNIVAFLYYDYCDRIYFCAIAGVKVIIFICFFFEASGYLSKNQKHWFDKGQIEIILLNPGFDSKY